MASEMPNNKNKKIVLITLAVLAAAALLGIWWWRSQSPNIFNISTPPVAAPEDSSSAINQEIGALDIGNLDAEFQQIDADLNQL